MLRAFALAAALGAAMIPVAAGAQATGVGPGTSNANGGTTGQAGSGATNSQSGQAMQGGSGAAGGAAGESSGGGSAGSQGYTNTTGVAHPESESSGWGWGLIALIALGGIAGLIVVRRRRD